MKNRDLIGQMVQETISEDFEEQNNVLRYQHEDFFEIHAFLDSERLCYVIHNNGSVIEVPQIWGPFKNRISSEFYLTKFDDRSDFISIMSEFYQKDIETIKIILDKENSDFRKAA